jgi:hypothetical protein
MESDKAFAPSTARHINTFHIFFEGLALATFLPEFWCITDQDGVYSGNAMFSRVRSSLDAILGENEADILKGRFHLGLTALRFFGVVRHWKQMWINKTFHAIDTVTIEPNKYTPTQASLSRADSEQFQSSGIARLTSNERRIQENAVSVGVPKFGSAWKPHTLTDGCFPAQFRMAMKAITAIMRTICMVANLKVHHQKRSKG